MKRNNIETLIGSLVIIIAAYFIFFAYRTAEMKFGTINDYVVGAKFEHIDGISVGSEIRIAGIKIGKVLNIGLDPETNMAKISMSINDKVKIPDDSSIQVLSDGLMGGKFLNIELGGGDKFLGLNENFRYTQSSVSIENLIGKYMFGGEKGEKK